MGGTWLCHWKHQEILLQKAPLCFLSLESLWKPRTGGFKQGVCLWKHRSAIHFQLSWVQTTHLWWVGSPHLTSSSMLQQILPAVPLAAFTLSTLRIWPVCFLILSEYLVRRWGTGFNSDSTLTSLLPQEKYFALPFEFCWVVIYSLQHQLQTITRAGETERNAHHAFIVICYIYCCWRPSLKNTSNWAWVMTEVECFSVYNFIYRFSIIELQKFEEM